jgi:GDP-L-fucose synthase
MIGKFHLAKTHNHSTVSIWGSGLPRREFLYSDDMAEACIHVLELPVSEYASLLAGDRNDGPAPLMNIGVGEDLTIIELAELIKEVVGFKGDILLDASKPDGTMRKLMDSSRLNSYGWRAKTPLQKGLKNAYQDFLKNNTGQTP